VTDNLLLHGDKFGDNRHDYSLGKIANVAIVSYNEHVPKEDRKPMTPTVCFEFCRTVPDMQFFGIAYGRECYCEPYFKMIAGDSSECESVCEGDTRLMCGGKSKSSVFSMHMCGSTKADLSDATEQSNLALGDLHVRMSLALDLSASMQKASDLNQKVFGKIGDTAVTALMQLAKVFAGQLAKAGRSAEKIAEHLATLVKDANKLKDFEDPDTVTKADRIMEGMETDIEESGDFVEDLGKITKLAKPSNEVLGVSSEYYPIMYFVDKKYLRTMQTCGGEVVNKPIVGESMDGCAQACNDAIGSCVGFSYFGAGKTSLCFLFSSFKSVTYYTGCRVPGLLQQNMTMTRNSGGGLQQYSASSPKIEAWPCTSVGVPFQVMRKKKQTHVYRLNIETGRYEEVLKIQKQWGGKPYFKEINACAINPVDSILYCAMVFAKDNYLVRIDTKAVAFVAKIPKKNRWAGTFDAAGDYFVSGPGGLLKIARAQALPAHASRNGAVKDATKAPQFEGKFGYDLVSMDVNLDGKGLKTYLAGMHGHKLQLVMNVESDAKQFKSVQLKAKGLPGKCKNWGSAWIFKHDVFFACNEGGGVFQLDVGSIDLEKKTATFYKAGDSAKTSANDGFDCTKSRSPFQPVLPPRYEAKWMKDIRAKIDGGAGLVIHKDDKKEGDKKIDVKVIPGAKVKEEKKDKGDGHVSPGQVYCMAKFSEFNGIGLKPDPSGKCKHCLKDLKEADKCY